MISLGIESSAYVFGVGIITDKGEILSNEKLVYSPLPGKGLIPHEAAQFYRQNSEKILQDALNKANLTLDKIDIVTYTAGPGIPPCLLVGAEMAIKLAKEYNKTLVPIHHGLGHIEIGKLMTGCKDPVVVYMSGGHTSILAYVEKYYLVMGETEDITLGNLFDKIAREMGLDMPGGPKIEELAKISKNYVELPYVVKGMDVSYSGILTAAINLLRKGIKKEDIAYSLQENSFAMLVETVERALAHTDKEEVLLVGGVAANKRLQEMLSIMTSERGANFFVVPQEYAGDCGINIAWTGILAHQKGYDVSIENSKINQKWRIDEVEW